MRRLRSMLSLMPSIARSVLLPAVLAVAVTGCRKATEIVINATVSGPLPAKYTIKIFTANKLPFSDIPTHTPMVPMVVASLGEQGDLDLEVTATTRVTQISLLPSQMMPIVMGSRDLVLSIDAPGYTVDPANAQKVSFVEGESQELKFLVTALPPDMGLAGKDGGTGSDGGHDAAMPLADLASHD